MKSYLLSSITVAGILMAAPAGAQQQQQQQRTANACDRLVAFVHQNPEADVGMSAQRLQTLRQAGNQQECRQVLARVQSGGQQQADDGRIIVEQTAPSVRIDQAEPRIRIQQAQPNVAVTQPQPQITVRQPAPQVTISIPKPEIVVRMPDPNVRVSQSRPEIQVSQPEPRVEVVQPEQQAQILTARDEEPEVEFVPSEQEANIAIERAGQPNVQYEAEEPEVRIQREEGEPTVRYETAERANANAAAGSEADQRTSQAFRAANQPATGAVSASTREIAVSDLTGMDVVNARGNQLGDIESLVTNTADNAVMAIVAHGGFLGLGEKKVAIPLENMSIADDRMVVQGLTDDDIRAMPEWNEDSANFRALDDRQQAEVELRQ